MTQLPIDTSFDYKTEPGSKVDPDRRSPTLRRHQQLLFSKPLPSGAMFDLVEQTSGSDLTLRHDSGLGSFELSSDTMLNSKKGPLKHFYDQMPVEENAAWHRSSIGARILFPCNQVNGKQTINQRRGTHPKIADRFDLTLETIRRHYVGESSPLADDLARYSDFFALFESFEGYVDFFLLNDLVKSEGTVKFFIPFASFDNSPLPSTFDVYVLFWNAQIEFRDNRNARIDEYQRMHFAQD
jgi:hypothetical protein